MLSNYLLPKSEVCCAVAGCEQHSGNAIQEGYNVSFHGFPKILRLQKIWAEKCKIVDTWDPQLSYYVCSMHFGRDDFIHDLETELSGYVPSYRYLRQGITPTLNLPNDSEMSKTPIECNSSLIKTAQRIREVLARSLPPSFLPGTTSIYSLPPTTASISSCDNDTVSHQNMSTSTDYKKLYNDTLNECNILKSENKQLLKKVEKKKKESNWTRDKVANAFALMYHSKRAYEYLKNELHYSLPEMSCFQQWAKAIVMNNGLIEDVLKIMKLNSENLKDHEKLTVLMFDEIKVYNIFNKTNDKVIGPYTNMHVVMALGIAANWKQPVFVDFNIYSIDNFPSPLNAVHILKMITLGKFTDIPNESNIMDNKHEEIMVAQVLKSVNIHFNDEDDKKEDSEQSDSDTIGENELIITKKDEMELSAIEFLAGWVALKYKSKIPEIGCMTVSNESNKDMIPSWMNHLSYNGLMIPRCQLKKNLKVQF
ncbi:uncharacterized protein LOC112603096 [Melanaphis sacchari]|uniref:uncharacterized protein LOC112603096 n=1 Tax=Melanaphis sacchari TaxID=742174 RepID=UPI000DC14422|nr:uncharacterized protein LOC112603096 [Melanaphis sacchari]